MSQRQVKYGVLGITFGGLGLLLALVHFWAGPFSPQPTLETTVAEKAISIRDATIKALKGEEYQEIRKSSWNADKVTHILTAVLAGLGLIMSMVSFGRQEPARLAVSGATLGISAMAFQFIAMYAMALLVVILIAAVLSNLGIS